MRDRLRPKKNWLRDIKATVLAIVLMASGATAVRAADSTGHIDTTWGAGGLVDANVFGQIAAYGSKVVSLPNDKTLHLVDLGAGSNDFGFGLFQLTASGALDTSFSSDGWIKVGLTDGPRTVQGINVSTLKVLSDNSILVVGNYYNYGSQSEAGIFAAKYDSTGAPFAGFGTNGIALADYYTLSGQGNWTSFSPVIAVSASGKIYAYYGTNGEYFVRLNADGSIDNSFGSGSYYRGHIYFSTSPLYANADVRVKAMTIDETTSPVTAMLYGVDSNNNPTRSSAVMYRLKFGNATYGGSGLTELDTSYAGTSVYGGSSTSTNGYARLDLGAFGYSGFSVAFSSSGFAYIVAGINFSTTKVIAAMDISQRRPYTSFGTNGIVNMTSTGIETIGDSRVIAVGPDKLIVGGTNSNYKLAVAKFDQGTGALVSGFGTNGVATLTACDQFHSMGGLDVTTSGSIIISASTNYSSGAQNYVIPRVARLGSGNATTQCGTTTTTTTSPPISGGGGGGGGGSSPQSPSMLASPVATAVEVPGEGIRVTVSNLAPTAKIAAMTTESGVTFGSGSPDMPWVTEGTTNSQTVMVKQLTFVSASTPSPTVSRTAPLKAGVTYRVRVYQIEGTFFMPTKMSSSVLITLTLSKDVADTTTTLPANTSTTTTTTVPKGDVYATAVPGVTVTDTKVYTAAPAKVAAASAIDVMTPAEAKTSDIVSKTPSVCLPNDEDLVFIDDGKCIAQVVNEKTRKVLRTLRTTVVADDISEIKVGNEIAVLSPLYFTAGTATMKASSVRRLNTMTTQVKAAGSILVAGHSGVLMGDTAENRSLSRQRAAAVVSALKKRGATAEFAIAAVGALDPVSTGDSRADQDKNRRAVVVLIP